MNDENYLNNAITVQLNSTAIRRIYVIKVVMDFMKQRERERQESRTLKYDVVVVYAIVVDKDIF